MFSVNFHSKLNLSIASHHKEIEKNYLSIANSTNSEQADDRASEPVPRYAGLLSGRFVIKRDDHVDNVRVTHYASRRLPLLTEIVGSWLADDHVVSE